MGWFCWLSRSQYRSINSLYTPIFDSLSMTWFNYLCTREGTTAIWGRMIDLRACNPMVRCQHANILFWSEPLRVLDNRLRMIWEWPSTLKLVNPKYKDFYKSLMRPHSSIKLLMSWQILSAMMWIMVPLQFLNTVPNPIGPGFPLEAPSKLILMNSGGGGH